MKSCARVCVLVSLQTHLHVFARALKCCSYRRLFPSGREGLAAVPRTLSPPLPLAPLDINCLRSYVLNPAHKWMLSVSSSPRRRRPPFYRLVPLFVLCSGPPGAIRRPPRLFVPQQKPHLPDKWRGGGRRRRRGAHRVSIRRALAKSFRSGPNCRSPRKKTWSGGGAGSCSHVGKVTAGKYSTRTTCAPFCNSRMSVLFWPASPSSADVDRLFSPSFFHRGSQRFYMIRYFLFIFNYYHYY